MALPRLIVTGSSGLVGRHLLDALKERFRIIGMARRSQARSGAPVHPNISWFQVDIGDRESLVQVFREVQREGGAEIVVHLAAHYDFTGEENPLYRWTNVRGLRNVLDLCRVLEPRRFIFASSVAACGFPPPGEALDEASPAAGDHIYAVTKRLGEEMLAEYRDSFPSCAVRFAALFSDWCEYPPLFMFLNTWLSHGWQRRILGGRGLMAVPYLHIREAVSVIRRVLDLDLDLAPGQVLLASPNEAVTTRQLFEASTHYYFGSSHQPLWVPKALCGPGLHALDILGRVLGERSFTRPWMARYLDRQMNVNARRSHQLLGWRPKEKLLLLRRLPFLIGNLVGDPLEWHRRNRAAMKLDVLSSNLRLHRLLERHQQRIGDELTAHLLGREGRGRYPSYETLSPAEMEWNHRVALRHLMDSVRTLDRSVFVFFCRDLAELRLAQGFQPDEVCAALDRLKQVCLGVLRQDPESEGLGRELDNHIGMTVDFGRDQAEETFEGMLEEAGRGEGGRVPATSERADPESPVGRR